jgi:hypothetical protein
MWLLENLKLQMCIHYIWTALLYKMINRFQLASTLTSPKWAHRFLLDSQY